MTFKQKFTILTVMKFILVFIAIGIAAFFLYVRKDSFYNVPFFGNIALIAEEILYLLLYVRKKQYKSEFVSEYVKDVKWFLGDVSFAFVGYLSLGAYGMSVFGPARYTDSLVACYFFLFFLDGFRRIYLIRKQR